MPLLVVLTAVPDKPYYTFQLGIYYWDLDLRKHHPVT